MQVTGHTEGMPDPDALLDAPGVRQERRLRLTHVERIAERVGQHRRVAVVAAP